MRALLRRMTERLAITNTSVQATTAGHSSTALAAAAAENVAGRGNDAFVAYGSGVVKMNGVAAGSKVVNARGVQPVMRQL